MGDSKFCYRCMEQYDASLHVCPACGFVESDAHDPMYVPPGTILHGKYLCGILLEYNGEGATYIGSDISTGKKVLIREYVPITLCTRVKNKPTISVNYNNLAKYKAFMAEYTELNKSLARLRNNTNIPPVLDMFAENNTTYTIFEYIEGVKMLDYLKENAGELSWEQVSKIFPPLFTTIGILHNAGIIHRAISPDTVYITDKGELKLSGFCVSAVRTVDAGLEYELFKGYAAPEQYSASSSSRQGSWTDVYGVSALLYRALTGCMPVDSVSRLKHDDLHEPHSLDSRIPRHVSRVIMEGMNLNGRDRIQTITELVTRLFEQPSEEEEDIENTTVLQEAPPAQPAYEQAVYEQPQQPQYQQPEPQPQNVIHQRSTPINRKPRRDDSYSYEKVNTVDRIKVPIIIGLLLLGILMALAVFILNIFSNKDEGSTPSAKAKRPAVTENVIDETETTNAADIEMPDLKNKFFEPTKEKWKDYFVLDADYEYNDDFDNDMIFEQAVKAGDMISQGQVIKVKVSKGKSSAYIPDFSGLTVEQYKNALEKAGISDFNYQFVESKNSYGKANCVVELQVDGKVVHPNDLFSNKDGKKLTVYYVSETSEAPQQVYTTAAPQTEPATTQAPATQAPVATTQAPAPTEPPTEAPQPTDPPAPVEQPVEQGGEEGGEVQ
ncbi:protein kinase domain-containing protein [Ruminococcus flavefaciens]|uniref:protein kinase domain-containing protein n=1 Tax=Ruminococcus flavefaciens TaxID=1265 RepID=UPI0026F0B081|nr:protein kinase [Ruminococcus flavefaciens]MDD7515424.1 protein kinase [Ruminococcus flavefaciens]MDY5690681.1 protein kinase [Ruminococcus flavefaciens]